MPKKKQQLQINLPKITIFSAQNQTQIANPKSSSIIKPKLQKKKKKKEEGKEREARSKKIEIRKKEEEREYVLREKKR